MNADEHRKAKSVVAWLAKFEDPDNPDYPIDRIKAERWPEVCAAVEADPDLSAKTIAERLSPEFPLNANSLSAAETPPVRRPATSKERARERVAEIKAQLASVTKPTPESESA